MARSKATEITFPQLQSVVDRLVRAFPVALEDVEPTRILYIKSDSKHSKKAVKISAIKVHPSVTPLRFQLTVYPQFDELDEPRQLLFILRELLRVEDFDGSKLGKYLLQDYPEIIQKFGVLWEEREDLTTDDVFNKSTSLDNV